MIPMAASTGPEQKTPTARDFAISAAIQAAYSQISASMFGSPFGNSKGYKDAEYAEGEASVQVGNYVATATITFMLDVTGEEEDEDGNAAASE